MKDRAEFIRAIVDFERRLQRHMHEVFCPVHLSLGHEEVAADLYEHLERDDWLFSTHRNHHHFFAKGGDLNLLWDEIMGLPSGLNQGFAGSQAIVDAKINFHASAIVGGLVGATAGAAWSVKNQSSSKSVVVCAVGDAATEQGVFWETLNFSALHSLPIIFICENNGKSVDSEIHERQYGEISKKVSSFGVKNVLTVEEAFEFTRGGFGPSFYEAKVTLNCAHLNMATMLDLCEERVK